MKTNSRFLTLLGIALLRASLAMAQSTYLADVGVPLYSTSQKTALGDVSISNGNLHIDIPLYAGNQRGNVSSAIHLIYDSKMWQINPYPGGVYAWEPNVMSPTAYNGASLNGWRFMMGDIGGGVSYTSTLLPCQTANTNFTYTDIHGTAHVFPFATLRTFVDCPNGQTQASNSGFATDQSGYQATASYFTDLTVWDPQGNQVYPQPVDTRGNFMTFDPVAGTLTDTIGVQVATFSPVVNNQQTLTVPSPNPGGTGAVYTFTYSTIQVATNFGEEDVSDYFGPLTVITNIQTPQGTSYSFTYDQVGAGYRNFPTSTYGELISATLPTGGNVNYKYSNFVDSYSNTNRWLTAVTADSATTSYTPSVLTQCSNNRSFHGVVDLTTGCQEQVVVTKPAGGSNPAIPIQLVPGPNDTVYVQTLNGGAWNTNTQQYNGSYTNGTLLVSSATQQTFVNGNQPGCTPTSTQNCLTSWRNSSTTVTTLADTGQSSTATTIFGACPNVGPIVRPLSTSQSTTFPQPLGDVPQWYGVPCSYELDDFTNPGSANAVGPIVRHTDYTYQILQSGSAPFPSSFISQKTLWDGNISVPVTYSYNKQSIIPPVSSALIGYSTPNNPVFLNTVSEVGASQTLLYDAAGSILSSTDFNGNATTYGYDQWDHLITQVTRPETNGTQHIATWTYDPASSALVRADDENSVAHGRAYPTTFAYYNEDVGPPSGKLQSITYPDGGTKTYLYNSANTFAGTSLQSSKTGVKLSSELQLDGYGRKWFTEDGDGISTSNVVTQTSYDPNGAVTCTSQPFTFSATLSTDGADCITQRDGLNRPLYIQHADGSYTSWVYHGNTVNVSDESFRQKQLTHDAGGRLIRVIEQDPSGSSDETDYQYNALNQMVGALQKGGLSDPTQWRSYSWTYDSAGHLISETSPESGTTSYLPDHNGNVTLKTDANGSQIFYSYDALNRVISKVSPQDTLDVNATFTYDQGQNGVGRMSQESTPNSAGTQFGYDVMGRVTSTSWYNYAAQSWAQGMGVTYDYAGNVEQLTYPDGKSILQLWDGVGHLASVSDSTPGGSGTVYLSGMSGGNVLYWPSGAVMSAGLNNNIVTQQFMLNSRLQVCRLIASSAAASANANGGNLLDQSAYYGPTPLLDNCAKEVENNGNISSIVDNLQSSLTQGFQYDSLNRLSFAARSDGAYNQSYNYDSFGNMIVQDNLHGNLPWSVDPSPTNRLLLGGQNLTYYPNGQLSSSPGNSYAYTPEGLLRSINSYTNGSYLYDSLGERTLAVHNTNTSGLVWNEYVYFNGQPMADVDNNGNWTDYIYAGKQKIAKVESSEPVLTISGTNVGSYDYNWFPVNGNGGLPSGYTVGVGDRLVVRQRQHGAAVGNGAVQFNTDQSASSVWQLGPDTSGQPAANDGTSDNVWHQRVFIMDPMAGNHMVGLYVGVPQTAGPGAWSVEYADMALYSAALGTWIPLLTEGHPVSLSYWSGSFTGGYTANPNWSINSVPTTPGASEHYYLADRLGTTQMELSSGGWPTWQGSFTPFGQEIVGGTTTNYFGAQPADGSLMRYKFTGQERDAESGLDAFPARYYASTMGRWLSPDPAGAAAIDPSNPQSLNRYAYVMGRSTTFTDPTGLDGEGGFDFSFNPFVDLAELLNLLGGSGPSFHGSTKPRPQDDSDDGLDWDNALNEHLGMPKGAPMLGGGLGGILGGSSTQTCEFGACGTLANGDDPSGMSGVFTGFLQYLNPFNHVLFNDLDDPNHRLFGTHYCGPGGGGSEVNQLDHYCHIHDDCYGKFGVDASVNMPGNHNVVLTPVQVAGIKGCNQALADGARSSSGDHGWASIVGWLTISNPFLYPSTTAH